DRPLIHRGSSTNRPRIGSRVPAEWAAGLLTTRSRPPPRRQWLGRRLSRAISRRSSRARKRADMKNVTSRGYVNPLAAKQTRVERPTVKWPKGPDGKTPKDPRKRQSSGLFYSRCSAKQSPLYFRSG